ncbi:MAG: transcriptional regulator, family [Anaerocolumna sp.]|nr:transcriptional regulator, family [Anaerocolumna sp.]
MAVRGFEERLMNLRKDSNYTQEELAVRLGVTPQAISKWERGMGYPDIELLVSLCHILNCSIDYLLEGENKVDFYEGAGLKPSQEILNNLLAEPVLLEIGIGLLGAAAEESSKGFPEVNEIRKRAAASFGILIPQVRIRDNTEIGQFTYRILFYDTNLFEYTFEKEEEATFSQIYKALEENCIKNYDKIFNKQLTKQLIDNLEVKYPEVIKGVIPDKISLIQFQNILIGIYKKKGNIHNLIKIVELLDDMAGSYKGMEELKEEIIKRLG